MMNRVVDIGRELSKKERSRNGRAGPVSMLMMVIDGDADRDVVGRSRAQNDDVSAGRIRHILSSQNRVSMRKISSSPRM